MVHGRWVIEMSDNQPVSDIIVEKLQNLATGTLI